MSANSNRAKACGAAITYAALTVATAAGGAKSGQKLANSPALQTQARTTLIRLKTEERGSLGGVAAKAGGRADDVPDDFIVVRGGMGDVPPPGKVFSGAAGSTLEEAASGVPHGQIRSTTAGAIRAGGGTVRHAPELTRSGVLNERHCPFGELFPNPVPKSGRVR